MPSSPLRIAVLECDTPQPRCNERYGGYGGLFKELLLDGTEAYAKETGNSRPTLDVTKYDVVNEEIYPDLDNIDAILISGSKYNSFDNDPWILKLVSFTERILAQRRVRIIGVCFGHQIVGRAMGARVDRSDAGWEISVVPMSLTPLGQELFGQKDMSLHQMHHDIVYTYPAGVEELAHSPRCAVQGMYVKNRIITVQGHPEFNDFIMEELLEIRHASGVFDDAMYKDAWARMGNRHDGAAVAKAFIKFLVQE